MAINYTALKNELQNDPQTYGYAADIAAGNDVALAEKLNKVRDGTDGEAAILVKRADISPVEVLEVVDTRDFKANPSILEGSWFESITQYEMVRLLNEDGSNTRVRANLNRLITDTNGSQTRLNAISNRNGSRAEQLFGSGTRLTTDDISRALRGT